MNRLLKEALGVLMVLGALAISADAAQECDRDYMKDPCAKEGYSVVESEKHVRPAHECMACAHYFPGEEPEGYCGGSYKGKRPVRAQSPVASVR